MIRAILSVILGYAVMVVVVVGSFSAMLLILGTERVYRPGSYDASALFNAVALFVTVVAALLGGVTARALARTDRPPMVLAGLVLVFGLLSGVMNMNTPDPGPRTGEVSVLEAAGKSKQPGWYAFALPFLAAGGVLLGSRRKGAAPRT